ncbi:hypothetical protein KCP78_24420 [Salmonella enterica subsp. enterica]|nr:hypothetical protein KCP78_24420 [Salmonella enterica subsp. enterica]
MLKYPSVLHSEDALERTAGICRKRDPVWKVVNVTMPDGASLIGLQLCATVGQIRCLRRHPAKKPSTTMSLLRL